jgi:hypothetical protein
MMISYRAWMSAAAMAGAALPVGAQAPQAVMATPTGPWKVNYADDSCRLARAFTDGTGKLAFVIDKFDAEPGFRLIAAGESLGSKSDRKVRVAFGPAGATRSFMDQLDAGMGSFGPSIMVGPMTLVEPASGDRDDEAPAGEESPASFAEPTSEAERAITWLEVRRGSRAPVRFELGPMDKPMAALRTCADELMTHWGIDAAAHRTLTRRATPRGNPGRWITNEDYPSNLVGKNLQALIQFRLSVAEDGSVSACQIQQSSRPAAFDKAVCDMLTRRARFDPALDADGKPIKSYWRSVVRFHEQRL